MPRALATLLLLVALGMPLAAVDAQGEPNADQLASQGDYYFQKGYYHRASEAYLNAVLEAPMDGSKKLAHGHALFAESKWAYSAYSLRRGLRFLGYPADLQVNVVGSFPSRAAFERALGELERYLGYYRNEPVGLTVAGYMYFFSGQSAEARDVFERLVRQEPEDPFARYFLRRLGTDGGTVTARVEPPSQPVAPPEPPPAAQEEEEPVPPPTRPASVAVSTEERAAAPPVKMEHTPERPPVLAD